MSDIEAAVPGDEKPSKRKLPLVMIAVAILGAGAAGAGAYFVNPVALLQPKIASDQSDGSHAKNSADKRDTGHSSASSKKNSDKSNAHGTKTSESDEAESGSTSFKIIGDRGVYSPDPLLISIRPTGRVRYLKVGYAVETDPDVGDVFAESELRIRDSLNLYLRAVDIEALEDPAGMSRIRTQIARRISLIVTPAPVHAVLITDFILS